MAKYWNVKNSHEKKKKKSCSQPSPTAILLGPFASEFFPTVEILKLQGLENVTRVLADAEATFLGDYFLKD